MEKKTEKPNKNVFVVLTIQSSYKVIRLKNVKSHNINAHYTLLSVFYILCHSFVVIAILRRFESFYDLSFCHFFFYVSIEFSSSFWFISYQLLLFCGFKSSTALNNLSICKVWNKHIFNLKLIFSRTLLVHRNLVFFQAFRKISIAILVTETFLSRFFARLKSKRTFSIVKLVKT